MTRNNLTILIADDHPVVKQGLIKLLNEEFSDALIIEASNGNEVINLTRKMFFNLIIMDISMPGMSGIEVIKQLKQVDYKSPVLLLSMHPEDQYAIRAIKAGAFGYLTKSSAPEELVNAIKTILAGKKYISQSVAEAMVFTIEKNIETLHDKLSDREFEVMKMIARGKTIKEIAEEFNLSVTTVSTYRARIIEKTGLKNNAEITHYTIVNKLI